MQYPSQAFQFFLLKTVVDKEKIDSKLKVILSEIEVIKDKVRRIESKPMLEKQIRFITDDIKKMNSEKKELLPPPIYDLSIPLLVLLSLVFLLEVYRT